MTRQDIYEWMLDHAEAFSWSEDGEEGLAEDDLVAEAMRLFEDKVEPEHYRDRGHDPDTEEGRMDFFAEIVAAIEEGYY